ncbi:LLM class flavin-dependent oxidoreductase [Pseudonocardia sp. NPDC049635]|uniref:LLM class flavin-dependent oxidoreductase n=1 Tax=Pseudonocardia sp. NPDC049635 TaxID=3155506 RepID=UPI0033C26052
MMELGLGVGEVGVRSALDLARGADAAGFDQVGVGDSQFGAESFTLLAAVAAQTERVRQVSTIAGWSRTPATTAHAAHTIAALGGRRFDLGIGPLPRARVQDWHGLEFDPVVPRMRSYLRALRACLDATPDAPTAVDDPYFPTRGYVGPGFTRFPVRLLLGATQRRMTELAAEVADGVMFNGILPLGWLRDVAPGLVDVGLARSGRDRTEFAVTVGRFCGVDDDAERARDLARHAIAYYFRIPYFRTFLEPLGFAAELDAGERALRADDFPAQVRAVSDRMVDELAVTGTPADVLATLERYEGVVDGLSLSGAKQLPPDVAVEHTARLLEVVAEYRRTHPGTRRAPARGGAR